MWRAGGGDLRPGGEELETDEMGKTLSFKHLLRSLAINLLRLLRHITAGSAAQKCRQSPNSILEVNNSFRLKLTSCVLVKAYAMRTAVNFSSRSNISRSNTYTFIRLLEPTYHIHLRQNLTSSFEVMGNCLSRSKVKVKFYHNSITSMVYCNTH